MLTLLECFYALKINSSQLCLNKVLKNDITSSEKKQKKKKIQDLTMKNHVTDKNNKTIHYPDVLP